MTATLDPPKRIVAEPGQRAFRPFGSVKDVLYAKDTIIGVCGPAGTGKSRGCIEKAHILAEKYAGCRILFVRKTRESMSESVLFTYEDKVLPEGHPINASSIRRSHRQQYRYPNGSTIDIRGLDKPDKIMSTEYDFIYMQEALECELDDVEKLSSRLRNGVIPYQQLLFDCNPGAPEHWIHQSSLNGRWRLLRSTHEDNPTLWEEAPAGVTQCDEWPQVSPDGRIGRQTKFGKAYFAVLDALTGHRYKRLRLGLWAGAEGLVYESFDPERHMWPSAVPGPRRPAWSENGGLPPASWKRIWVIDFGFTVPMCLQKWAIDSDGRAWMYQELYKTRMLVEDFSRDALEASGWRWDEQGGHIPIGDSIDPLPYVVIADHDAEGRATFERYTGFRTINAVKNITGGIQAVEQRLKDAGDGLARFLIRHGANWYGDQDKELSTAMKPTCTAQEVNNYVWDESKGKKDVPVMEDDHGMDCWKYLAAFLDGIFDKDLKAKDVPFAASESPTNHIVSLPRKTGRGKTHGRGPQNEARDAWGWSWGSWGRYGNR